MWGCALRLPETQSRECVSTCDAVRGCGRRFKLLSSPLRCSRLGLVCLAYLWRRKQRELLQEMIEAGVQAIVIKVASMGRKDHFSLLVAPLSPMVLTHRSDSR